MKVNNFNEGKLIDFSIESLTESIGDIIVYDIPPTDCGGCSCVGCGTSCGGPIDCGKCDDPPSVCPSSTGGITILVHAH